MRLNLTEDEAFLIEQIHEIEGEIVDFVDSMIENQCNRDWCEEGMKEIRKGLMCLEKATETFDIPLSVKKQFKNSNKLIRSEK